MVVGSSAYRIVVRIPQGKRLQEKPLHKYGNNTKMDIE
jgi:hypothetical protein